MAQESADQTFGLNLATLETQSMTAVGSTNPTFNAPDSDSYVSVSAVFY